MSFRYIDLKINDQSNAQFNDIFHSDLRSNKMCLAPSEDVEISFPPKILRLPMVKERTGLARSTIYLKISQGEFPKSISLGDRSVGWVEEEITSWIEQRIQSSRHTNEVVNENETKQQSSEQENALTSDNLSNSKQDEKAVEEISKGGFE